jgi:hypothetical protein
MPVECSNCHAEQVVQVRARFGAGQYGPQMIECVACKQEFDVLVPDQILAGPIPLAELPRFDLNV